MGVTKHTTIRLSRSQRTVVSKLALKLGISQADVIRIAIARLAQQEGMARSGSR